VSGAQHTPGPWLSAEGEWLHDPQRLLTEPANAWVLGSAPDLLEAHLAWEAAEDARNDCTDEEDGCDNEGPWEHCPLCSERFGRAIDLRHAAIAKARGQ
jgi:hypothetical protein